MKLRTEESDNLKQLFPRVELSYETLVHKKVHNASCILAIPEGGKYFAWFTNYKSNDVCILLPISDTGTLDTATIIQTSFDHKLAYGTVLYGTLFKYNHTSCFSIEDIFYYKGKKIDTYNYTFFNKLNIFKTMLSTELSQTALTSQFIIFGLPLMSNNFNSLLNDITSLPYKITKLKYRFFDKHYANKILYMKYFKPTMRTMRTMSTNKLNVAIFGVKADVEFDIYNLYAYHNGEEEIHSTALIQTYTSSVFMNKLFRNIKENANLDALEESDDEEEFESEKHDKFVHLDKHYKIICHYNSQFKKWYPVKLANRTDKIVLLKNL